MLWHVQQVVALRKVIQLFFPCRRDLTINVTVLIPSHGWNICPLCNTQKVRLSKGHKRESKTTYCYLNKTIVLLYTAFFWIQESLHDQGNGLGFFSSVSMHFFLQNPVQNVQSYSLLTGWVALHFVLAAMVHLVYFVS